MATAENDLAACRKLLDDARRQWSIDTARMLNSLAEFTATLGPALGEISGEEARAAVQKFADELLEKM